MSSKPDCSSINPRKNKQLSSTQLVDILENYDDISISGSEYKPLSSSDDDVDEENEQENNKSIEVGNLEANNYDLDV